MKNLCILLLAVILSTTVVTSFAQTIDSRQKLYTALPQSINVEKNSFASVLQTAVGTHVSLPISAGFTFEGTVISNFIKYDNLQTVIIQSTEDKESIYQITKIEEDNIISYAGRILNKNAADGYEIKNIKGQYSLQKFETLKLLDPCKL